MRLVVDADYLLYLATMGNHETGRMFKTEDGEVEVTGVVLDKKRYRRIFKDLVKDLVEKIATDFPGGIDFGKKPLLVFSDPEGNFRYDLFPDYKKNRAGLKQSPDFYALRKWAHKKYFVAPHMEADDVVAWYARHGHVCVSMDKDLLRGAPGRWYNPKSGTWTETTREATEPFVLLQTIMGDSGDGIPGVPGIGEVKAGKWLGDHGYTWDAVVECYKANGLSEDDAILMRRLVGMDQAYRTKKGKWKVRLWKP